MTHACHQCDVHTVRFEGDICEDCAWDLHDQLDGFEEIDGE